MPTTRAKTAGPEDAIGRLLRDDRWMAIDPETIATAVAAGSDPDQQGGDRRSSLLHRVAAEGSTAYGDRTMCGPTGATSLVDHAVAVAHALLDAGADPDIISDTGMTPLDLCALTSSICIPRRCSMVGALLSRGASPSMAAGCAQDVLEGMAAGIAGSRPADPDADALATTWIWLLARQAGVGDLSRHWGSRREHIIPDLPERMPDRHVPVVLRVVARMPDPGLTLPVLARCRAVPHRDPPAG